jgi:hypothetical protein
MSLEWWKAFFEIGGVVLLLLTFAFGAGALIVNNRLNAIQATELNDFKIKFEGEQQKTALAQKEASEAKAKADKFESDIATADQKAAEANAKAEGFRADIAKANESAKQAEARAAEAKLELARFKAPRTLSASQRTSIAALLRPLGPQRVDLIVIGDAPEITDIAGAIIAVLKQAGWTVNVPGKAISGPNVSGVLIGTHMGSDRGVNDAADALISALQSAHIVSGRFSPQFNDKLPMALMGVWDEKNVAPIRILVSAKP